MGGNWLWNYESNYVLLSRESVEAYLLGKENKQMIDMLIKHLDYLAMAVVLLGYFRMSAFKVDGWLWTCLGSILLVIFGLCNTTALGVAIGNAIFVWITIRGFLKWRTSLKKV